VRIYVSQHTSVAAVFLVAISNFEVILLLNSRVFLLPSFDIGWDERVQVSVRALCLIGFLIEDVSQFVILVI